MAHWYKANVDFLEGFYMRHPLKCPHCMTRAIVDSTSLFKVPNLDLTLSPRIDAKGVAALICPVCKWSIDHEHRDIDVALQRLFRKAFVYADAKACAAFCGFNIAHGSF